MITSIKLQNFKGHLETFVPLGRLTVLVGPNGTGKTSVLQALQLLTRLKEEGPADVLRGDLHPQDLFHRAGKGAITLKVAGTEDGSPWDVEVKTGIPGPDANASVTLSWTQGDVRRSVPQVMYPFNKVWSDAPPMRQAFGPAVLYSFNARQIAAVSFSDEERPAVAEDGGNTATVLAALKLENEEVFEQIEQELRQIVPSIQRIRVRRVRGPQGTEGHIGHKIFLDFKNAPDVPAHAASEGTLVTLALLTALCSPNRPRVLLLDDIDQSLHPQAQMELMRELKKLLEGFPELQIVATTHSPYVLDELAPSDVRVFALREDGDVVCRSLDQHPQASKMSGILTAGQLWSLDPEKRWVLGER
jgi:ABC-type branched-subunit amino acid transport system ATPase component